MNTKLDGPSISRRGFLVFAGAASSLAFAPRQLFAQDDGLVQMARRSAASANITVQKLRGKITVLMGAGGNIAIRPITWPSSFSLQERDSINKCEGLLRIVPIGSGEVNGQRNSTPIADQMTLAAEFSPICWIGPVCCPQKPLAQSSCLPRLGTSRFD